MPLLPIVAVWFGEGLEKIKQKWLILLLLLWMNARKKEILAAGYREIAEAISSTKGKNEQKIMYSQINNSLSKLNSK